MSKSKRDKKEVVKSKSKQQKEEYLKIPLTVYQHTLISILLFVITGTARMDQLGDVIYDSLCFIQNCRLRPLISKVDAARLERYKLMDGQTCGTSLSGRGCEAFMDYLIYVSDLLNDEFILKSINFGEVIISLLVFYIISESGRRKALASQGRYASVAMLQSDDLENVRLCIFDLEDGLVDDQEVYPTEDFVLSILGGTASSILEDKSSFITDAYERIHNHVNEYANIVVLRLRSLISDLAKTDKSKRRRWRCTQRSGINVDT